MKNNKFRSLIFILFSVLFINKSFGACAFFQGGTLANLNFYVGTVPATGSIGTTIYSGVQSFDSIGGHTAIQCGSAGTWSFSMMTNMTGLAQGSNVYATNIPGIGVKLYWYTSAPYGNSPTSPLAAPSSSNLTITGNPGNAAYGTGLIQIRADLIRLASTITPGSLYYSVNSFMQADSLPMANIAVTGNIIVPSCTVNSSSVNVGLDTVLASNFTGAGITKADKNFPINLTCQSQANIYGSLSFVQNTGTSDTSVIQLTGAGSPSVASGVGIQILYNGTPLNNNTKTLLKTSSGGSEFPTTAFTARYYQTQPTVTAGDANATATLNLTYQ